MASSATASPIRVGLFESPGHAQRAVSALMSAGFHKHQITVISSDEAKVRWFREFEHESPAGTQTTTAAVTGGAIGAAIGGATAVTAGVLTGGLALVVAGGLAAWAGGVVGSLVGMMMTRGVEKGAANYYDQSVAKGKILVAVEDHGDQQEARLALAARLIEEAGALPRPLEEG